MFDNINQSKENSNTEAVGAIPAKNDPERPVSYPGRQEAVTDMFADIEKPEKPDIFKPKPTTENDEGQGGLATEVIDNGGIGRKVVSLLVVIIGLALLLGGGYYGYKFYKDKIAATREENQPLDTTAIPTETDTTEPLGTESDATANQTPADTNTAGTIETGPLAETQATSSTDTEGNGTPVNTVDTDQDGLTDSEEEALGTSPANVDSDADGLSDREEIKVYKTYPLNPDTDADGFSDGDEVKNGYNPNGQGKLYDINQNL